MNSKFILKNLLRRCLAVINLLGPLIIIQVSPLMKCITKFQVYFLYFRFDRWRRYNARGFDLNRNFPDYFKANTKRMQPETEAYKEWISKIQFTLSAGLHGGALVASYPFDNTPNSGMLSLNSINRFFFQDSFKKILGKLLTRYKILSRLSIKQFDDVQSWRLIIPSDSSQMYWDHLRML